jgi:hypothetical protein
MTTWHSRVEHFILHKEKPFPTITSQSLNCFTLSDDVLCSIFSYLSYQYLHKFLSLSRTWYNIVSTTIDKRHSNEPDGSPYGFEKLTTLPKFKQTVDMQTSKKEIIEDFVTTVFFFEETDSLDLFHSVLRRAYMIIKRFDSIGGKQSLVMCTTGGIYSFTKSDCDIRPRFSGEFYDDIRQDLLYFREQRNSWQYRFKQFFYSCGCTSWF